MTAAAKGERPLEVVRDVVDSATAAKVFGEPIVSDGTTVVPVAKISGGGGGGSGNAPAQEGADNGGTGGGVGVSAKPMGVYVIRNGDVKWRPPIDVNRAILGAQVVAVVALLVLRAILKARKKHRT